MQNDIRDKKLNLEYIQRSGDEFSSKSSPEASFQLKSELRQLKSRYQSLNEQCNERVNRLEECIRGLKQFQDDYMRALNTLNRIEAHLQIEHHASSPFGSAHGKSIEAQRENLNSVKQDLDLLHMSLLRLNEHSQRLLYSSKTDLKFTAKLKTDMNDLNEKLSQLMEIYVRKQNNLEEMHKKSTKVDNEIEELENWMTSKEREILEDEGVIVTEEQFDQRTIKYKQLKSELERKESQVKRILETGNEMLKTSTGGIANVADLARNMIAINTKWSNLHKKVDAKNRLFTQFSEQINELRRKYPY
jgi:DNA repair exonuclease SbcCD ATPase subunit